MFNLLRKARDDTQRLTAFYRRLTSGVGILGCLIGVAALIPYMYMSREVLGLPVGQTPLEGIRIQFALWVIALLIAIPVLFYVCTVLVAGILGGIMLLLGKMTREEVVSYMFFSQYPNSWFAK
jgi:hypothetical protein